MYQENIRNLVGQRQRETQEAMMSQKMTTRALKNRNMNRPFEKSNKFSISKKQKQKVQSVNKYFLIQIFL